MISVPASDLAKFGVAIFHQLLMLQISDIVKNKFSVCCEAKKGKREYVDVGDCGMKNLNNAEHVEVSSPE